LGNFLVHLGILGHRGLLRLDGNQIDLEQGNKIAVYEYDEKIDRLVY